MNYVTILAATRVAQEYDCDERAHDLGCGSLATQAVTHWLEANNCEDTGKVAYQPASSDSRAPTVWRSYGGTLFYVTNEGDIQVWTQKDYRDYR